MFIIRSQGQVFQVVNLPKKPLPPEIIAKRGIITYFSSASRRRLTDFLCRMDNGYRRATFVTLTFTGYPTPKASKQALKRFLERVRYTYPEASGVWRAERQERGSLHFHIIFFNLPFWKQSELQKTWEGCTGENMSIVHIKLIRSFAVYRQYISKYVAKVDDGIVSPSLEVASYQQKTNPDSIGRVWGYHQKELLPIAPVVEFVTDDEDLGHYAMFACVGMSRGHCGTREYSRKCYTDQAANMLSFAAQHASSIGGVVDDKPDEDYIVAQWFGSPAVRQRTSVPLAAH